MTLKVMSVNLWLLPFWLSKDINHRLDNLAKLVKKEKPDVICMQEVWLKININRLKKRLPDYYMTAMRKGWLNWSGLVTFTKQKPTKTKKIFFGNFTKNIMEKMFRKGFLTVEISHEGKETHIINTHLHYSMKKTKRKIEAKQLNKIKKYSEGTNYILAGDLNIDINQFPELNNGHWEIPDFREHTASKKNKYVQSMLNKLTGANQQIDYIIPRKGSGWKFKTKVLKKPLVSDHYPLIAFFKL